MGQPQIVVFTGSGVSAESGLGTFRGYMGLWEKYDIQEVASIDAWYNDKKKVLDFYNMRRRQLEEVEPNQAHYALSRLENYYDVTVITQNVDDLHERAGTSNMIHLHGELKKACSSNDKTHITNIGTKDINPGDKAVDGSQLRPYIVWFGEPVPMMQKAYTIVEQADYFIVIGTSLMVYPAANLIYAVPDDAAKYFIDPSDIEVSLSDWNHIKETAASGTPKLVDELIKQSNVDN